MRTCQLGPLAALLLSACAVGPDFQRPARRATDKYTTGAQPEVTAGLTGEAGAAQHFVAGRGHAGTLVGVISMRCAESIGG